MKSVNVSIVIASFGLLTGLVAYNGHTEAREPAHAFISPGKAMAAVTMTHSFSATPAVGQPMRLELVFAAGQDDMMQLEIHADDALAVKPLFGRSVDHGERVVVDILPQAEGRYYVNIIARLGMGNEARARVFSVPVQVGTGSVISAAQKATISPNGERLIRMQAQEQPAN